MPRKSTARRSSLPPVVIVLGGPNGAGKSTIARELLQRTVGIMHFVNADTIAAGLSAFDPNAAAVEAGRIMLARLRTLAAAREHFAFESTLSSRLTAAWLSGLVASGYEMHLVYVALDSPERAIRRVGSRVLMGGHTVEPDVIRRRFYRSLNNLFRLYIPLASRWRVLENSGRQPRLIATGGRGRQPRLLSAKRFEHLRTLAHAGEDKDSKASPLGDPP